MELMFKFVYYLFAFFKIQPF